jgi:hypothetical protein
MTETDLEILEQGQAMLAERLRMVAEERATFLRLSGPERAIEAETWLIRQIEKALAPLIARLDALEKKPSVPPPTALKPPKEFISAIGRLVHDEIKPLDQRITTLEKKIENFHYCGVHANGLYHAQNFCTFDGSLWHANVETRQRPGDGPDWTLVCKRGQNGRDGVDAVPARHPSSRS